jgi:hypothetical protein
MPDMDKRKDVSPESPRATIDRFLTSVHTTVMILLPAIGGKCPRLGIGKCNLKYQRGAKAGLSPTAAFFVCLSFFFSSPLSYYSTFPVFVWSLVG